MRFAPDEPLFNTRISDDPLHRAQVLAEKRAIRNGRDPIAAGRTAMCILKMEPDASLEIVICAAAGEYRRAA